MVSFYCFEFTHEQGCEQGCSGYKANKRDAMKLFHGSNVEVVTPKLMPMVRALDFGRAFLVDYAIGMYEFYHVEAIENAFADLDRRLSV